MSDTVDKRIIEMEFDNAQFKQRVGETISQIKSLDESLALENGANGLNDVVKSMGKLDFSGLTKGLDEAKAGYKGFKDVAIGALNEIGKVTKGSLIGGGILGALTSLPVVAKSISGGMNRAAKLAQSAFQFEGLGVTGTELNKLMDRVSESVNDTAYGLDQAASVASMLFASGVQDVEALGTALDNVSNVAATFNANYDTIADVMSKVASKGRMQGEEFNQLAHAGMNAKAVIAEYLRTEQGAAKYRGLIEQFGDTEAAVNDMSSKGVISFELLNDSLSKFAGNAKKSNNTLSGVTANIGSALSRTTADFFQSVLHNTEGVIRVLNDVRFFINNINKATNELMHNVKDNEGTIVKYGTVIQGTLDILKEVHKALDGINNRNSDKNSDGLSTLMHRWHTLFLEMQPLLEGFFNRIASVTEPIVRGIIYVSSVFREVLRIVIRLIKPVAQAFDEVFGPVIVDAAKTFMKVMQGLIEILMRLAPSEHLVRGIYYAFKLLFSALSPVVHILGYAFKVGLETVAIALRAVWIVIEAVVQAVVSFADALSPIVELIGDVIGALFGMVNEGGNAFLGFLKDGENFLDSVIKGMREGVPAIKAFFQPLKDAASAISEFVRDTGFVDVLSKGMPKAAQLAGVAFKILQPILSDILKTGLKIGTVVVDSFKSWFSVIQNSGIGEFFSGVTESIAGMIGMFAGGGLKLDVCGFGGFSEVLKALASSGVQKAASAIEKLFKVLGAIATVIWNTVSPAIEWLGNLFGQLWGIIGDVAKRFDFTGIFAEFAEKAGGHVREFFDSFETGKPNLLDFLKFLGDIKDELIGMAVQAAPKFAEFLGTVGQEVSAATDGPLGDLFGFVNNLKGVLEELPGIVTAIPTTIGNVIGGLFGSLTKTIKNPFAVEKPWADTGESSGGMKDQIAEYQEESFNLANAIYKVAAYLKDPLTTARDTVRNTFVGAMKGIGEGINEGLGAISFETITMFIENCKNVVVAGSALWGTIALVSVFESIREIFLEFANWSRQISNILGSVTNLVNSVSGVFTTISKNIDKIGDAVAKSMRANNFIKYALSTIALIGVLVGAIMILGRMPENELRQGALAVTQIMGVLLIYQGLMLLIGKLDKEGTGAIKTLAGLSGMGLALLMVARAIGKLGSMDPQVLDRGAKVCLVMMVALGIIGALVGFASRYGMQGAVVLGVLSIMLRTLVATIGLYAVMPWEFWGNGLEKVVAVLGIVWAVMMGLALAGRISQGSLAKAAVAIVAMSGCLLIMAVAIGLLNAVTMGDSRQALELMLVLAIGMISLAGALTLLTAKGGSNLGKAALSIAILTACLLGMSLAIAALNFVTLGNPMTAVTMGGVLVGMLMVMAVTLSQLGNKTRQLPAATKGITVMTIALAAIAGAMVVLTMLASWNIGAFITAGLSLAVLMGILGGVIIMIGRQGGAIASAVPAIWQMTLAIAAIGLAVSAMMLTSGGNWVQIVAAAGALSVTMILMAAAIKVISGAGGSAAIAATALLEMAGAMAIMAVSLALLGSMSIPQLLQGFIALVAAVVLLGVAAVGISAVSEFFLIFDGVLLLLGVALLTIAGSFYIFVESLAQLAQIAPEAFQSIIDNKDKMVQAFAAMGEAVAAGVMAFFAALIQGIGSGISGVASEVSNHGPEVANAAESIGKALVEGIIYGLGGLVVGVGTALIEGVRGAVEGAAQATVESGSYLSSEMASAMTDYPETYGQAGQDVAQQYAEGVNGSEATTEAGAQLAGDTHDAAVQAASEADSQAIFDNLLDMDGVEIPPELQDQFKSMMSPEMFQSFGVDSGKTFPDGILGGIAQNPLDPTKVMQSMKLTTTDLEQPARDTGHVVGEAVSSSAAESMASTDPVSQAMQSQLETIRGYTGEFKASGEENASGYASGFNAGAASVDISPAVSTVTSRLAMAIQPARQMGTASGQTFTSSTATAISSLTWSVANAARMVVRNAGASADGSSNGASVGGAFASGMSQGIYEGSNSVAEAARYIVHQALEAAKKEADSHSPSKKMIEQGHWFGEGYAIGIRAMGDLVALQAAKLTTMAMEEAKQSFGVMGDYIDIVDWDATPTITPVLDTSQYEAAFRGMSKFDANPQIERAGWANRIYSNRMTEATSANNQNGAPHVEVHLNWEAGITPNQMAQMLASSLENHLNLEGE